MDALARALYEVFSSNQREWDDLQLADQDRWRSTAEQVESRARELRA